MRALVKCISLFGLGIGLYLGDLKHVVQHTDFEKAQQFIDVGDYMGLHELIKGLSEKDQIELFNQAPIGKKTEFKNAHRATRSRPRSFLTLWPRRWMSVQNDDGELLAETIDELST